MAGILYLLPTIIAEDTLEASIPPLVVERARQIRRFYVEAAKTARAYLKMLGHPLPIAELAIEEIGHEPDPAKLDSWLAPVLQGENAAIVSESGCPGIADPGALLVRRAHELGIRVVPLVGPSSLLLTLMASGLDGQRFAFHGYLPIDEGERRAAIQSFESVSAREETSELFIETPYRNQGLLEALVATLHPSTRLTVATDVTGAAESIRTLRVDEWRALLEKDAVSLPKLPTVFAFLVATRPGYRAGVVKAEPSHSKRARPAHNQRTGTHSGKKPPKHRAPR